MTVLHRGRPHWSVVILALMLFAPVLVAPSVLTAPPARADQPVPAVAITSPTAASTVRGRTLRVSGTATGVSDLSLVVGGQRIVEIAAPDDSGRWQVTLDISDLDGRLDLATRGLDPDTLTTVWSRPVVVEVDNPAAARPEVTILSPHDGDRRSGRFTVTVAAQSPIRLRSVEVRVNGGRWQRTHRTRAGHQVQVTVHSRTFASIEARASDVRGRSTLSPTVYLALNGARPAPVVRHGQDRAIWIWERASYEAVFTRAGRDRLAPVLDDTSTFDSDPIRTIYLGVDRQGERDMLRDSRRQVADFVSWARSRGYRVQATVAGGTRPPAMGALPQFQHFAVAEFEKVLNYNLAVPAQARFEGVNVDIEPYLLGEWKEPGSDLPQRWLDLLETLMQRRDASGQPLLVGPAIPRWFDSSDCCAQTTWRGVTKPLSDHVQDITDYISIMDYRDTADGSAGIIAQAQHEIDYAEQIGKQQSVVIGVETKDLSGTSDPETVTFWEEGRSHLEAELDKTYAAFSPSPAFAGVALHHFDTLLMLPASWEEEPRVYYPVPGAGPGGPALPRRGR